MHNKKFRIFFGVITCFVVFFVFGNYSINAQFNTNTDGPQANNQGGGNSEVNISMTKSPTLEDQKCKFTITVSFDEVTDTYGSARPNPQGFVRDTSPSLQVGTKSYSIDYYFDTTDGYAKQFNMEIEEGMVCVGSINNNGTYGCTLFNTAGSYSKNIGCTPSSTTSPSLTTGESQIKQCTELKCDTTKGEQCLQKGTGMACVCISDLTNVNPKKRVCCGVELLTNVPFIGKCIELRTAEEKEILKANGLLNVDASTLTITEEEAFPRIILGLTKILVTVILLASFGAIIVAGVMMAASGSDDAQAAKGRKLIGSVIVGLALLGASGVILRLINPNFFG